MTTTSAIPITVDGVRLDTFGYNVETLTGRLSVNGVRGANPQVGGRHGSIYVPNKSYEDGSLILSMWVVGNDENGAVSTSQMAHFRTNVDMLSRLFSKTTGLLDIRQTWPAGVRQCFAECVQTFDMSARAIQPQAKFNVALNVPGAFWQDVNTSDYTSATGLTSGTVLTMAVYDGTTAPMEDGLLVVRGPATNPRLTDAASGSWVQFSGTIASGTDWQIDLANWTSKTGSALAFGAGGTSVVGATSHSGLVGPFLSMSDLAGGPQLTLTGSGFGANTQVLARARRKFLL